MVSGNTTMNLIVQSDLFVCPIVIARQLNTIHSQVGLKVAWLVGVFTVDLRQRDESACVQWP